MLDILDLAADSLREKLPPGEESSREAYCQALLDRLRQRNQVNEAMIIKFIRRNTKKRVKSKLTLPIMQGFSLHQTDSRLSQETKARRPSFSCLLPLEQTHPVENYQVQEVKPCELKTTSNTMEESEPSVLSTPHKNAHAEDTLHLLQHVQQQANKKFSRNQTPSTQGAGRGLNNFTKYLRNFFISKLNHNSRLKEQEMEMRLKARKSYHGRVQTEVQTELKQKIKVKSLVFGQSEVVCKREGGSITQIPQARLQTQIHDEAKQPKRYGKAQQNHKREKAVLPAIHNSLAARNKRCLQNYIRLHQDQSKREKPLDFRTVKLPTEADLFYNQNTDSRRGVGRLDVLHVRKM